MDKMANEMHGTLFGNVQPVSGGTYQAAPVSEEAFLHDIITPIYEVLRKVIVFFYHTYSYSFYENNLLM